MRGMVALVYIYISLMVSKIYANTERFQGSVPLFVLTECPVGGYVGYIRKALEKGYLEHPGLHAVLTKCLRFSSILDSACVACCLFLSTGSHHVCIQIHAACSGLPRCSTETSGSQNSTLWGCEVGAG